MNNQNIIEAVLKEDNLNNVLEAISLLRQGLNEYQSSRFACSVMWTVLRTKRISEKQAAVIAKECEKVGISFLWSILDEASCIALGIELPEKPAEVVEEVKAEEVEETAKETEEGSVALDPLMPTERFDLVIKDKEGRIRRDEKDIDWEETVDWLCTYAYYRKGEYSFQLTYAYDDELLDYRDFLPERAALGLEEVADV